MICALTPIQRRMHGHIVSGLGNDWILADDERWSPEQSDAASRKSARDALRIDIATILRKCGAANKVHLVLMHVASLTHEDREAFLRDAIARLDQMVTR